MAPPVNYHYGEFPPQNIDWAQLVPLVGPANAAIARYDGLLTAIPNASVLLSPLTTKEAVLSSRIEGTQATMGEVLEYEAEPGEKSVSSDKEADINEIINYRAAMREAENLLKTLPLCNRILNSAHRVLLSGVRGHGKSPGEYRKTPNWIGPKGCTIEEARYIPISSDKLRDGMSEWEKYIHTDQPDILVQLGILHAEFEALHPFLDGNGRLGRMCVPLFMLYKGIIQSPMFYISEYLEKNRDEYYNHLLAISRDGKWTKWCAFFLTAIIEQSKSNQAKAESILKLYEDMKIRISELTRSQYAIHAVEFIFNRPAFNTSAFVKMNQIPTPTARTMIRTLRDYEILREIKPASGRRPAVLVFPDLINITEGTPRFS